MRKTIFTLIILLLASPFVEAKDAKHSSKQSPPDIFLGFQTLPFGSSHGEVRQYLIDKNYLPFDSRKEGYYDDKLTRAIRIHDFKLGSLTVAVVFLFNHNYKFYAFYFETMQLDAGHFNTIVQVSGRVLTDVFKAKYGTPKKCFEPTFIDLKTGSTSYLCTWNQNDLEIYTGFSKEALIGQWAETTGFQYAAVGYVSLKSMGKEQEEFERTTENEDTKEAVGNF